MMIGIIGNGSDKFTWLGQFRARKIIWDILNPPDLLVSGHSIMIGIDIWSEQIAIKKGCYSKDSIFKSIFESKDYYRIRNDKIARFSDELNIIVADRYPDEYKGQRFDVCYHHHDFNSYYLESTINAYNHVKSGAC